MTITRPLPKIDPRTVPVFSVDSHLPDVPARHLTPEALRARFRRPPVWTPESSVEKKFGDRQPAPAAVLIALVMRQELTLLLTERGVNMSTHSGQIAFPGGRTDASDRDPVHTALREADEEIGLPASHVEVLGSLPIYVTGTAFIVTPVVALVRPGFELKPNPAEVADVFEVHLSHLMSPANHRRHAFEFDGAVRQWFSMPYTSSDPADPKERYIWGATAAMLRNFYRFMAS